jgi:ATP-binding cassette subfamily B protein
MEDYFEEEDFNTRFSGHTVVRILQQVVPYLPMVIGFLLLVVLITIADSIFTYFGKQLVDNAIVPGDTDALRSILTNYFLLSLVSAAVVFGFIYITGVLGEKVRYDLRRKLFDHLQRLSFSYFDKTPVGWIMSRVTSDTERIADLVTWPSTGGWRCWSW